MSADSQRRGRQQTVQTSRQQVAAPHLGSAAVDNGGQQIVQTLRQQGAVPPLSYAAVDNGRQQKVQTLGQQVEASSLGYAAVDNIPAYGDASNAIPFSGTASDLGLKALTRNIPGVPGEDYPVFAEVPETAFTCEGQVNGG